MNPLEKFLQLNKKTSRNISIAVVGDVMIDEYYQVTADRISPEFPIPVMQSCELEPTCSKPGGAANVAMQFKHFNASAMLFGFSNRHAQEVIPWIQFPDYSEIVGEWVDGWVKSIPVKKRFYCGDFPLCRWDVECPNYRTSQNNRNIIHNALHKRFKTNTFDVLILSDYDKGFFNDHGINVWLNNSITTIVDPKKGPASKWRGCTVFKPNTKEAEAMSGSSDWKEQCDYFFKETECQVCLITQGAEGVVGKTNEGYFQSRPDKKVSAKSVIGAGDCFVAFLAMAMAHGMTISEAVEVAFGAGAVYVQSSQEPITPQKLSLYAGLSSSKIITPAELVSRDFTLSFANGCFDVLHEGHVDLLKFAKQQSEKLVVALNSDASVKRLKGNTRPINSLDSRLRMLTNFDFIDYLVSFDEDTPLDLIREIRPDVIVKGGDYQEVDVVGHGLAEVKIFPLRPGLSTTSILKQMQS